jgi:lipopolysaccharide/colanic/teichoic acid biosynthesis glycosyltransferase
MATRDRTILPFQAGWLGKLPQPVSDHSDDFLTESQFRKALRLERRRAERSRKLFLLVLLASPRPKDQSADRQFARGIEKFFATLAATIRETDLWGWYEDQSVGGIIFTEFNGTSKPAILATVSEKLDQAMRSVNYPEHSKRVRLSFHFFPEDWTDGDRPQSPDEMLYPDLAAKEKSSRVSRAIKRCIDVCGSLFGLTILSPVFAAVAIAIKLDSKGPIFFRQERIGQYGARFDFLKFRSMKVESAADVHKEYIKRFIAGEAGTEQRDAKGKMVFKIAQDKRVTRVGSFLRRMSLDELPQLINVLLGEMSLVGPRPPVPYELESYHVWHMRRILEAKPGITGLWQVMGRSRLKFDDMVRLDLRYAETQSLWVDIKILLRTPLAVIIGEGAY